MWFELLPGFILVMLVWFQMRERYRIRDMEHRAERLEHRLKALLGLTAFVGRAALRGENLQDVQAFNSLVNKIRQDKIA